MNVSPLVAQDLGKRFRREWSLRGLTLEIPQGAVVGLAGPNAAGKSTLLALATGLLAPTDGTISVLASCTRSPRKFWVRRISAAPGRNASTEPGSARSAAAIASAICRSSGASGLRPR